MLSVAGLAAYSLTPWIGVAVAAVMLVVVASYRQNVHAYPSGGGDYEVVTTNLGANAGLDGGQRADGGLRSDGCGFDGIGDVEHRLGDPVRGTPQGAVLCRCDPAGDGAEPARAPRIRSGLRRSDLRVHRRRGIMLAWGLFRIYVLGEPIRAESAGFVMHAERSSIAGFAMVFLVARSFSSGCAALTGVEAISNGVPAFQKPKSRNAATTLLMLGTIAVGLFMGIILLAKETRVQIVDNPAAQLAGHPARLSAEDPGHPDRAGRLRQLPDRLPADRHRHRADPGAGGQHRVQRIPGAWVRCWHRTATCPASCTPAATGWRSPTASCSWRWRPSRRSSRSGRKSPR